MITEKGQLPVGIVYNGKTHKEFVIRPQKVRDSVEALEDERANTNNAYLGIALLTRQIEAIGDMPKDKITTELLMDMYDVDIGALNDAKERLAKRLKSFRGEDKKI
ncbi:MAG: hypothetical protein HY786_09940 [Deltaproteobacteria bacterium]|nr:hypothetical protein [Deltaproteobacteria bacterium]